MSDSPGGQRSRVEKNQSSRYSNLLGLVATEQVSKAETVEVEEGGAAAL